MIVYVVEDDESIRELVVYTLNASGFQAVGFADSKAFLAAIRGDLPDLIILDIMLPGEDGISILGRIRADRETRNIPVIMLTAKAAEYDRVRGLDSGADDYIAKPFGVMELVSRVRAVLRRSSRQNGRKEILEAPPVVMDTARHSVAVEGNEVTLTLKEFELLRLLLENSGQAFTREQLLDRIWGYSFDGETRTVDVHVRSLRKKLGPGGDVVETVRGLGYRIG